VLELNDVSVHFQLQGNALSRLLGLRSRTVKAVDGVTVSLRRGEVLGLVGEAGRGKTTLGRSLLGLVPATGGDIHYHGKNGDRLVSEMRGAELRQLRTDLQMVFQDPHAALNPSMTIEEAVGHPLVIHGIGDEKEILIYDAAIHGAPTFDQANPSSVALSPARFFTVTSDPYLRSIVGVYTNVTEYVGRG
jgi:peptide/nickel transport system ATP-binding protein